jgi:hypothetical protein
MAIYAKIDTNKPILNGGAATYAPPAGSTMAGGFYGATEELPNMDALQTKLNGRYKIGGATGWERQGSDLA